MLCYTMLCYAIEHLTVYHAPYRTRQTRSEGAVVECPWKRVSANVWSSQLKLRGLAESRRTLAAVQVTLQVTQSAESGAENEVSASLVKGDEGR